jgi:hypothetical protein
MSETKPKRYQCRHIFTDGHRCGSICLRGEEFCYYHHTTRKPAQNPRARRGRQSTFDLPITDPNDRTGLQSTIVDVLRRIAANDIDPRRAGLLLYGLQIASLNLPKPQPAQRGRKTEELETVEEITTHPELGILAPIADADEVKIRPGGALDLLLKAMAPKRTEPIPSDDAHKNAVISTGPQRSGETCFSTAASATATQSPQPITLPTLQATAGIDCLSFRSVAEEPAVSVVADQQPRKRNGRQPALSPVIFLGRGILTCPSRRRRRP